MGVSELASLAQQALAAREAGDIRAVTLQVQLAGRCGIEGGEVWRRIRELASADASPDYRPDLDEEMQAFVRSMMGASFHFNR